MSLVDLPPYIPPPPTKYSLDYAPLTVIDLSIFDRSSEDRVRLVDQLRDAAHNTGFWMVTGHGITDDEINRQLSIGQAFYKTPLEDKRQYPCNFAEGRSVLFNGQVQRSKISIARNSYMGYREPVRFIADTDVKENHESVRFFIHLVPLSKT